ncbi:MAG: hypothetical protein AAGI12_00080 [Pseudomonadota bacterium]
MKLGVATSLLAHGAVLGWAVVSIAAPKPLSVPEVEALPIDIIPIESITKTVQGDRNAKPAKVIAPSPRQTKTPPKPDTPEAENIGDTNRDAKAEAPKVTKAPPVEKVSAPEPRPTPKPKAPEPAPVPEAKPEPKPEPVVQPTPEPAPKTDIAMLLKQTEPVQDPLTPEAEPEKPQEQFARLPDLVPAPKRRPEPPKKAPPPTKKALLDKRETSAGGAKRNERKAALGTKKGNNAAKLSTSEIDALRGQIQACWNVGALAGSDDAENLRARVEFSLNRNGEIDGRPTVKATGGNARANRTFAGSARRAVIRCAPYQLPADKFETWSDVAVNFSLADMLE